MKRFTIAAVLILLFVSSINILAQKFCSDNGDGTYTNPVIAADFPDPDVIRVDSDTIIWLPQPCLFFRV